MSGNDKSHLSKRDRYFLRWHLTAFGPLEHFKTHARIIEKDFALEMPWNLILILDYTHFPERASVRMVNTSKESEKQVAERGRISFLAYRDKINAGIPPGIETNWYDQPMWFSYYHGRLIKQQCDVSPGIQLLEILPRPLVASWLKNAV